MERMGVNSAFWEDDFTRAVVIASTGIASGSGLKIPNNISDHTEFGLSWGWHHRYIGSYQE